MKAGPRAPGTTRNPNEDWRDDRNFKDFVASEIKRRPGLTEEQAIRDVTVATVGGFAQEHTDEGILHSRAASFRMFNAALSAQVKAKTLRELVQRGKTDPDFRPFSVIAATPQELKATQDYLTKAYKESDIPYSVIEEYTALNQELIVVTERLYNDPDFRSAANMEELIENHPHLAADVARMLEIQRELQWHEHQFDAQVKARKSIEQFKQTALSYPSEGLIKPVAGFFNSMQKAANELGEKNMIDFLMSGTPAMAKLTFDVAVMAGQMTGQAAKLFAHAVKAANDDAKVEKRVA